MVEQLEISQIVEEYVGTDIIYEKQTSKESDLPAWFAFDEKAATDSWNEECNHSEIRGITAAITTEVESTVPEWFQHSNEEANASSKINELNNDLPSWFAFDEQTAVEMWAEDSPVSSKKENDAVIPEWFQFSAAETGTENNSNEDSASSPEWFAFDEKVALLKWEADNPSQIVIEVQAETAKSTVNESELPSWFLFADTEEKVLDNSAIQSIEKADPERFHFSNEGEHALETKPAEIVESKPIDNVTRVTGRDHKKGYNKDLSNDTLPASAVFTPHVIREALTNEEPVVFIDYDSQASEGLNKIAASLDSMDYVTKAIAKHMAACNGTDGHKVKSLTQETVAGAREKAMLNVMNTAVGQKLSRGEEITDKDQQQIDQIVSLTYESTLGINTTNIRESGVDLSDRSQVEMMMPYIMPEHVHGAGCDHGGSSGSIRMSSGGISFGSYSLSSGSFFDKVAGKSGHEHHDKLFFCARCKKNHKIHVHNKGDVVCPQCKSRNIKEIKKQYSH